MKRALELGYIASGALAAICVFGIFALMMFQSIAREFGVQTGGTNDVVSWLCAATAFLAMAHTFKHGDFVRVGLLTERLSPQAGRYFELAALAIACLAIGYLAWSATLFTHESWQFSAMSDGILAVPLWIPQSAFVVGAWMLLIAVLEEAWIVLRGGRPTYVTAVEQRHAAGDFSSDV